MASVYIKGADKAIEAAQWITSNLKDCEYELSMDPPATFSDRYRFNFRSKVYATVVALRWGNEYGGI